MDYKWERPLLIAKKTETLSRLTISDVVDKGSVLAGWSFGQKEKKAQRYAGTDHSVRQYGGRNAQ